MKTMSKTEYLSGKPASEFPDIKPYIEARLQASKELLKSLQRQPLDTRDIVRINAICKAMLFWKSILREGDLYADIESDLI